MTGSDLIDHGHSLFDTFFDHDIPLRAFGDVRGLFVLDAGCGQGRHIAALHAHGAHPVGIDLHPAAVEVARARMGNGCETRVGDLRDQLDFPSSHFDGVLCSLVLHYIEDWQMPLSEFERILRPGGRLVVTIQHPFADFLSSGSKAYRDTEAWAHGSAPSAGAWSLWRRPLGACIQPFIDAGLRLTRVCEPEPVAGNPSQSLDVASSGIPQMLLLVAEKRHPRGIESG
jgi:SAM-dependent methyltransferase